MDIPAFGALCDKPCQSIGATTNGQSQVDTLKAPDPNFAGIVLVLPRPLGGGVKVLWRIKAADGSPVQIRQVGKINPQSLPAQYK